MLFWRKIFVSIMLIILFSRDEFQQSNRMGAVEIDAAIPNHSSDMETEAIGAGNLNESNAKSDNSQHQLDDVLVDELADFDEDTEPVNTTQENGALRRRKRMVIDFEDDEE